MNKEQKVKALVKELLVEIDTKEDLEKSKKAFFEEIKEIKEIAEEAYEKIEKIIKEVE
jgi:choline kinase